MAKRWNRTETWLTLAALGVGGLLLAAAGLWVYVSATAIPLHPNPGAVPSSADAASSEWADAIARGRQEVRTHISEKNLPGLSVAVGVKGDLVWAEGFGWADLDKHVPVATDTRFRIGTASTVLASAAAGLLVEKGALNLDAEVQTYVPEFPKKPWPVTVRQVMAHVAGLGSDGGDEGPLFGEHCDRPVEGLHAFAARELRSEPGTQYRFSNYGWIVVSAVIEAAAAEPFLLYMQRHILGPLHMDDTMAGSSSDPIERRATSYFPRFAADPRYGPDPMREIDLSCYAGAGAFVSTPSDLVRFAAAMHGGTLLQPATVQMLQTSMRLPSGQETGYGLGWDIERVSINGQQLTAFGHDGDLLGGVVASLMTLREPALSIAVMSNTSYADTAALALKIAEGFAGPSTR